MITQDATRIELDYLWDGASNRPIISLQLRESDDPLYLTVEMVEDIRSMLKNAIELAKKEARLRRQMQGGQQ